MYKKLLLLLTLFVSISAAAQKGIIKGKVVEQMDGREVPMFSVNVVVPTINAGASTDFDGNFTFKVSEGDHQIHISMMGYTTAKINLTVKAEGVYDLGTIVLSTGVREIDEFIVKGTVDKTSKGHLDRMTRISAGLEQRVGTETLKENGSSNVGAGVTKMAGVSMVGSNTLFVRGMGDRYNAAYLNGMPIASPDPDKKVISLNLFPSNIVQSITVKKAFTPDMFGDFAGGAVDIITKDFKDEPTINVSLGTGFNTNSTFKDFNTYDGGRNDFLGRDDGTRDMPAAAQNNSDFFTSRADANHPFKSNFSPITQTAPLNSNFGLLMGNYYELNKEKDRGLGILFQVSHKTNTNRQIGKYKQADKQDQIQIDYDTDNSIFNTSSSVLANLFYHYNDHHRIKYNALYANISSDQTREVQGFHFDYPKEIFSRRMTYRENTIKVHQLSGEHGFVNDRLTVKWWGTLNTANSKEPDRRQLVFFYDPGTQPTGNLTINTQDINDNHRFYSDLEEQEVNLRGEVSFKVIEGEEELDPDKLVVTTGCQMKDKERNFDFSQFNLKIPDEDSNGNPTGFASYFPDGIDINNPDVYLTQQAHIGGAFFYQALDNRASAYIASQNVTGIYGNAAWEATDKLSVYGGARLELGVQTLNYRDQQQPTIRKKEIISSGDILPALSLKYKTGENSQARIAFSKTISRPGFREVGPFQYIEYFAGMQTTGNPELENGANLNLDLRYEIFPNSGELVSFSVFGKQLQNPIERVMLAVASGQLMSFQNAQDATVTGVEVEIRKKLTRLGPDKRFFMNSSVSLNASYIYSQVEVATASGGISTIQTNSTRPLQGASPYLLNIDYNYTDSIIPGVKSIVTLAYNVFGRRIFSAGIQGIGDIYEMPSNTTNLTVRNTLSEKWDLNFSVKNLLNPDVQLEQQTNETPPIIINNFKRGVVCEIGVTYRVF